MKGRIAADYSGPGMTAATSGTPLEDRLAGLLDLERSRAFHAGRLSLDLSRMEALLAALPSLPRPAVAVHVAGSEGKTSTTEFITAGLLALGLQAASYTSPHLLDVRERLRIGLRFPPEPLLRRAADEVDDAAAQAAVRPSYFEYLTALARVLFAQACVDAVVWETGLGGRLDATRLLPADLCVVTSISLEHTAVLGQTLPAVAAEKAGILRPGAPLLLGASVPDVAREVLGAHAANLGCRVVQQPPRPPGESDPLAANRDLARLALDALAAEHLLPRRTPAVDAALDAHVVAGRWQRVGQVLFDGAHTVAASNALARRLAAEQAAGRLALGAIVFGATLGRDPCAMLAPLAAALPPGAALLLATAPGERGVPAAELLAACPGVQHACPVEDPSAALAQARALSGGRTVLVTGSLYLVGRLLAEALGGHAMAAVGGADSCG
jgi:dihydrofolate synthase/folylpolyglutamate synthase